MYGYYDCEKALHHKCVSVQVGVSETEERGQVVGRGRVVPNSGQ